VPPQVLTQVLAQVFWPHVLLHVLPQEALQVLPQVLPHVSWPQVMLHVLPQEAMQVLPQVLPHESSQVRMQLARQVSSVSKGHISEVSAAL